MKKLFALIITLAILATVAVPAFAQDRNCRRVSDSRNRTYNSRSYYDTGYYDNSRSYYDYGYRNRNVWDRHRDKITVAAGTGAGAAIGAMLGGRRGALIGAIAGAGGSALYTYKLRNRRYRY